MEVVFLVSIPVRGRLTWKKVPSASAMYMGLGFKAFENRADIFAPTEAVLAENCAVNCHIRARHPTDCLSHLLDYGNCSVFYFSLGKPQMDFQHYIVFVLMNPPSFAVIMSISFFNFFFTSFVPWLSLQVGPKEIYLIFLSFVR